MIRQGRRDLSPAQLASLVSTFAQSKAEDDKGIDSDDIFVRTSAFIELVTRQQNHANTVILGRKGDGKTALLRKLEVDIAARDRNPGSNTQELFGSIDIQESFFVALMEEFEKIVLTIVKKFPKIPVEQIAMRIWSKYLRLAALQMVVQDLQQDKTFNEEGLVKHSLRDIQYDIEMEIGASARPQTKDVSNNFLSLLSSWVRKFRLDDAAMAKDVEEEQSGTFDVLGVMRDLDPKFKAAAVDIAKVGRYLTLTIDRFDDYIDHLVSSGETQTRYLRRNFLHGLIAALSEIERLPEYSWLRIVASLPEDLAVDLDLREIASLKRLLFLRIRWSEADLAEMLDNRIRAVIPDGSWDALFPNQIQNTGKNVQRKEGCADYIIRHTTRRPRELMYHAYALFTGIQRHGRALSSEDLSEIVARTNIELVKDQILPEWKTAAPQLTNYFQRMVRVQAPSVFTMQKFSEWSAGLSLLPAYYGADTPISDEWKSFLVLPILFRIGVLGFRVRQQEQERGYILQGENDYAKYIFNHTVDTDPIGDLTSLLGDPKLPGLLESDAAKSVRALVASGRDAGYDIRLCFAPLFFESMKVKHIERYVVDEITRTERAAV